MIKYIPKNITTPINIEIECTNKESHDTSIHYVVNSTLVDHIPNVELGGGRIIKQFYPPIKKN